MNKKIILYLFFLLIFQISLDANDNTLNKYSYIIKKGDSFASILKEILKADSIINANTPMVKETIKGNPQISDWRNLQPGQSVTLYVNPDFIDKEKMQKQIKKKAFTIYKEKKVPKEKKKKIKKTKKISVKKRKKSKRISRKKTSNFRKDGFYASMFYLASIGTFNQRNTEETVNIEFNQNSPWSLGLSGQYYFPKKRYLMAGSFYLSSLESPRSNFSDNISIPNEIGGNLYFQYDFNKYNISSYIGSDIEQNSSFTLDILKNDKEVVIKNNLTTYLTVGAAYFLPIKKSGIFAKVAYSKSVFSKSILNLNPDTERLKYDSYKFMLYLNYKISDRWFLHTLYKYHNMSGEDLMSISRVGFGFGFVLF